MAVVAPDLSALRDWDAFLDQQLRAGGLRRYDSQPNLYLPGLQSERFAQYHEGIRSTVPIWSDRPTAA